MPGEWVYKDFACMLLQDHSTQMSNINGDIRSELSSLPVKQLRSLIKDIIPVRNHPPLSKSDLLDHILDHGSPAFLDLLRNTARRWLVQKDSERMQNRIERKRKRVQTQNVQRKTARMQEDFFTRNRDTSKFMELPSPEEVHRCYREFYHATSGSSLAMKVCAVCAREVNHKQDGAVKIKLEDLPNRNRLRPNENQQAHDLFDGLLLEPAGVEQDVEGVTFVVVCYGCRRELSKQLEKPPQHSLTNNLWIGRVPWELDRLTLPEQLLVSLLYPRVFVFKLYAKGGYQHESTLQRGMRARSAHTS